MLKFLKKPLFHKQRLRWLPKITTPFLAKKRILLPLLGCLGTPLPPPPPESVRTYRRAYAGVRTKNSWIVSLPNFLTHGAPLCGLQPQRSSAITVNAVITCNVDLGLRSLRMCFFIFHRLADSVDVSYKPSLDYEKIKNHVITLPDRKTAFLLQALRWVWTLLLYFMCTLSTLFVTQSSKNKLFVGFTR